MRQQKPDPSKPIFVNGYTHHLALPEGMKLNHPKKLLAQKDFITVSGPVDDIHGDKEPVVLSSFAAVRTITTYPFFSFNQQREGTPICDFYHIESAPDVTIVTLTDGCNWGLKSWLASRNANTLFSTYLREHVTQMTTVQETGLILLQALQAAHQFVISNAHDIWSVGQTTILGGVVLRRQQLQADDNADVLAMDKNSSIFVSISLGDCKCFHYSSYTKEFEDLSLTFRSDSLDAMDPGGRIGPYQPDGLPDLRNLALSYTVCNPDDILVLCSDGVHDNLDPQYIGLTPESCGLTDWSGRDGATDEVVVQKAKAKFMHRWLREKLVPPGGHPTPESIVTTLVEHADKTTQSSRDAMEANSDRRLPKDFEKYPGKMDHTACVALYPFPHGQISPLPPPTSMFPLPAYVTDAGSRWKKDCFPDAPPPGMGDPSAAPSAE